MMPQLFFLDSEGGSQKATLVVLLLVVTSSLKIPKGRLYECHSTVESTQLANLSRLNVKTIARNPKRHSSRL